MAPIAPKMAPKIPKMAPKSSKMTLKLPKMAPDMVLKTPEMVPKIPMMALKITNMAGSPTAFRLLLAARHEVEGKIKGQLRAVSSAGEPLTPEVIRWFSSGLGCTIHDHYGQTELGMVLCNHHALSHTVRIGTAGYAMPGHRVVVIDDQQRELEPGKPGMLALDRNQSPLLWFNGYAGGRTKAFVGHYYLSGDTVELNADGTVKHISYPSN